MGIHHRNYIVVASGITEVVLEVSGYKLPRNPTLSMDNSQFIRRLDFVLPETPSRNPLLSLDCDGIFAFFLNNTYMYSIHDDALTVTNSELRYWEGFSGMSE